MRLAIFFVRFLKGSERFALAPYLDAQSQIKLASALTENQLSRQTLFVQLADENKIPTVKTHRDS